MNWLYLRKNYQNLYSMGKNKKITVIVLAAGKSERFGQNKILYELDGVPVIIKTLKIITNISTL